MSENEKIKELYDAKHEATYCPEDNKLRLYVGRVSRDEYMALKGEGWTSTPKQSGDFCASWNTSRYDTCLEYAGLVGDEDASPADRAERFAGYRDARLGEATDRADDYESRPSAHGYQSEARAARSAARHDRVGARAVDAWSKAEYWVSRTAGVIANALYLGTPSARMGRIKTIEKDLRRVESFYTPGDDASIMQTDRDDSSKQAKFRWCGMGRGGFWEQESRLDGIRASYSRFVAHCKMRIAYETQMLEAQGGRLASVDILPGGRVNSKLVVKVSKSSVTKRVTSVKVLVPKVFGWTYRVCNVPGTEFAELTIETERMGKGAYEEPDAEGLAELKEWKKSLKELFASFPKAPPLLNPTEEDALRLQALWNGIAKVRAGKYGAYEPREIVRMSQKEYSLASKGHGDYAYTKADWVYAEGKARIDANLRSREDLGTEICKIRRKGYNPARVVVLTDKPRKSLPPALWEAAEVEISKERETVDA